MENHLMNYSWSWYIALAIILIDIIFIIYFTSSKIRKLLYNYFWKTPQKTTEIFAHYFALIPSFMLFMTLIIIIMDKKFDMFSVISLLPLVVLELPRAFYNFWISFLDDVPEKYSNLNIHNGLTRILIEREKHFIHLNSIISVISSYIIIYLSKFSKDEILWDVIYVVSMSILTFVILRGRIYFRYLKKENKAIKGNRIKVTKKIKPTF